VKQWHLSLLLLALVIVAALVWVRVTTSNQRYPVHKRINATVFWVGEAATLENDYIPNDHSLWDAAWQEHYGGIDNPNDRNGFYPAGFVPKENPFYCALPFADYTEQGLSPRLEEIPWHRPITVGQESLLKNSWIRVMAQGKTVYCQWEDVGPFNTDDWDYVFGSGQPKYAAAGIDVSPAVRDFLGLTGRSIVDWQFVNEEHVPSGPWKEIVTTSQLYQTDAPR